MTLISFAAYAQGHEGLFTTETRRHRDLYFLNSPSVTLCLCGEALLSRTC